MNYRRWFWVQLGLLFLGSFNAGLSIASGWHWLAVFATACSLGNAYMVYFNASHFEVSKGEGAGEG